VNDGDKILNAISNLANHSGTNLRNQTFAELDNAIKDKLYIDLIVQGLGGIIENEKRNTDVAALLLRNCAEMHADITAAVPALMKGLEKDRTVRFSSAALVLHHVNKKEWDKVAGLLDNKCLFTKRDVDFAFEKYMENILDGLLNEKDFFNALKDIKGITSVVMKAHSGRKSRSDIIKRRKILGKLAEAAQQIRDKINPLDKDKKFPVKHQPVRRTQVRKVIANG